MAAIAPLRMMALPGPATRDAVHRSLADAGIDRRLGASRVPARCLHQSLSDAVPDLPHFRAAMLRAGGRISAGSVRMTFDRVYGPGGLSKRTHWSLRPRRDIDGFDALLDCIRESLAEVGVPRSVRNTAHMTVSYDAPGALRRVAITPVTWTFDEVQLVLRHDRPYRYETIACWPLAAVHRPEQLPFSF